MTRGRRHKPQSSHSINFASEKTRLKKWRRGRRCGNFFAPKKLPKRCKGSALDPIVDLVSMGVTPRSFDRWLVCTCSKWFSRSENQTLVHNFIVCGGGFHLNLIVRWYPTTQKFWISHSFFYATHILWKKGIVQTSSRATTKILHKPPSTKMQTANLGSLHFLIFICYRIQPTKRLLFPFLFAFLWLNLLSLRQLFNN